MKASFTAWIFSGVLTALLIIEGWGIPSGYLIVPYIVSFSPLLLFLSIAQRRDYRLMVPQKFSLLTILFLIIVYIGTLFAVNMQMAFEHRLMYLALFVDMLIIYNFQNELVPVFRRFVLIATICTLAWAGIISINNNTIELFLSTTGQLQFVNSSREIGHNGIGAFMIIPVSLLAATVCIRPTSGKILTIVALGSIVLLSFLRASYAAVSTVLLLALHHTATKKVKIVLLVSCGIFIFSALLVTKLYLTIPFLSDARAYILEETDLTHKKSSLLTRKWILEQSVLSIRQHPLLGIGSYNYYYSSLKNAFLVATTTGSSHNIFVDYAVENGIPAVILFGAMICLLLKNMWPIYITGSSRQREIFFVFIAILLLFQLSHYHRMYFLLMLFFVTPALLYREKQECIISKKILAVCVGIVTCYALYTLIPRLLVTHNPTLALHMYPLYGAAHRHTIAQAYAQEDFEQTAVLLEQYAHLYSRDPFVLEYVGFTYESMSNKERALSYYTRALEFYPLEYIYMKKVYRMTEDIYGKAEAEDFLYTHLDMTGAVVNNIPARDTMEFLDWCAGKKLLCNPERPS